MELLYHYLWKNRLFGLHPVLDSGEDVEILDPGTSNSDAGPDFFNAKVKMKDAEWVGNVEIHTRASDWIRHAHHNDRAYDTVILHVVGKSDCIITRTDGSVIPQMTLSVPKDFYLTYAQLKSDIQSVRCANRLYTLSELIRVDWIETLAVERLETKASRIMAGLEKSGGDWNTAAFCALARGLGFGLNSDPFEMLAKATPLKFLLRHSDNRLQLEAILFGQAGLIPEESECDEYGVRLKKEYDFLRKKYDLTPISRVMWRFARTRPQNFPHRRIAFLADSLYGEFDLPGKLRNAAVSAGALRDVFSEWKSVGYWKNHYSFGIPSPGEMKGLSKSSVDSLLINVAAPYLYAYASCTGDLELGEKARYVWLGINPERNSIIKGWDTSGFRAQSAFETQGLIQLRKEYCDKGRCFSCRFGHALMKKCVCPDSSDPVYRYFPES